MGENNPPPIQGQIFESLEEAEIFYKLYAKSTGFGIRIKTTRKRVNSNDICSRLYECHRGATPCVGEGSKANMRKDSFIATGCKAKMFVVHKKIENHWIVSTFESSHNHPLVSPNKVAHIHSHKKMTPVARQLIEVLNDSGIGPSRMMNVLTTQAGGIGNVGFNESDIRNEIRTIRRQAFDRNDAQSTLNYFKKLQIENSNFFYHIKIDEEQRIDTIFWVDSRSRYAYENFGDVITFDTTYRTNKYDMPFAPFTGVNHHYQSILFGFALLRDETEDSFVWLFETWLQAMNNKQPKTIVTDQDKAMSNAIARVFPNSHHALCSWHISNKYPERLHHVYIKYSTFKLDFNRCVYKSLTIEEFEERWNKLMDDYSLKDHQWLQAMYELKHKWIPAYSKRFFAAGMTTTSRSESMNSFFNSYVSTTTGIKDFVMKTQQALERKYEQEKKEDYETTYKERKLLLRSPLEICGAKVYTKEMFRRFQIELQKSIQYSIQKLSNSSTPEVKLYTLSNALSVGRIRRQYTVIHFLETALVRCTCQMFEHAGMVCRHIFRFFTQKSFSAIPDQYILPRWTRNSNRIYGTFRNATQTQADYEQSETLRYNHLCNLLQGLASEAASTFHGYQYLINVINSSRMEVENLNNVEEEAEEAVVSQPTRSTTIPANENVDDEFIFDPILSQTKGRKRSTRMKSSIESPILSKKLRKCAICNKLTDHDKRNHDKFVGSSHDTTSFDNL